MRRRWAISNVASASSNSSASRAIAPRSSRAGRRASSSADGSTRRMSSRAKLSTSPSASARRATRPRRDPCSAISRARALSRARRSGRTARRSPPARDWACARQGPAVIWDWGRSIAGSARRSPRARTSRRPRACSERCACDSGRSARRPRGTHTHPSEEAPMARVALITSKSQVAPEGQAAVDGIVKSRGSLQGPFTVFLHAPELAGRVAHLGAYVRFEGELDMRVRVLAAMTVARELDAVYVWGAQTGSARKQGVPESTITAIREGHSRGVPSEDAQIIDFTRRLLREHRVDNATFEALRKRFGERQLLELTGTIGYYAMLAMTVNACELEAAPGAEVLKP